MARFDWGGAEAAGRRAIELDPQYIFGWTWLSLVLSGMGRFEEARVAAESAVSVDPLSPMPWTMTGWALNAGRRFDEAERPLRQALELNARHGLALWNLGICLIGLGREAEAVTTLERSSDRDTDGASLVLGILAWTKAVAGRCDEARRHVDELHDQAKYRHVPRYTLAWTLGARRHRRGARRVRTVRRGAGRVPRVPAVSGLRPDSVRTAFSSGVGASESRLGHRALADGRRLCKGRASTPTGAFLSLRGRGWTAGDTR